MILVCSPKNRLQRQHLWSHYSLIRCVFLDFVHRIILGDLHQSILKDCNNAFFSGCRLCSQGHTAVLKRKHVSFRHSLRKVVHGTTVFHIGYQLCRQLRRNCELGKARWVRKVIPCEFDVRCSLLWLDLSLAPIIPRHSLSS